MLLSKHIPDQCKLDIIKERQKKFSENELIGTSTDKAIYNDIEQPIVKMLLKKQLDRFEQL